MLFNTMSGRKEVLKTIRPGRVSMFVCGPTVQGRMHMGHARTYVFYDVMARYLAHLGYGVDFVVNITDIDEKITRAAREAGVDPETFAREQTERFLADMKSLEVETVTSFEPVSRYLDEMKRQVADLVAKGKAYAVDGWVYFDASAFQAFGRLSHLSKSELMLRPLELSLRKRNLLDFALWRPETLVEGKWKSPWGLGSPGWHIQDTAVTLSRLGAQYDIHGGAYELIYPHHEAEIAQAESITGKSPLVRYWVHTRLVNADGRKMSKSVGNVYDVREALRSLSAGAVRLFLLSHRYREDMDLVGMEHAQARWNALRRRAAALASAKGSPPAADVGAALAPFYRAMDDDLDTPRALGWLASTLQERPGSARASMLREAASTASNILGVGLFD